MEQSQNCPIVIDADALNLLAMRTNIDQAEYLGENVILTPHPGELGRLMDSSAKEAAKNLLYFLQKNYKKSLAVYASARMLAQSF